MHLTIRLVTLFFLFSFVLVYKINILFCWILDVGKQMVLVSHCLSLLIKYTTYVFSGVVYTRIRTVFLLSINPSGILD